ncbi:MAG: phosphatase PAP2-related protein [Bacteroidetes bacterium]|nr:phosphatase PAP2-related protein [Bacteroidota bacterium]MDA1119851.1 phosphatase PAP2-related protein [Bacteroidota bacterium]
MTRVVGWGRTLSILGCYILIVMAHSYVLALGETRLACVNGQPLYDIAHDLAATGNWFFSKLIFINHDVIIFTLLGFLIFLFIGHPQRQILIRRYLVFNIVMSVIRALLIFVTTIPNPNGACTGRYLADSEVIARSIGLTLSAMGVPYDWHSIGIEGDTCCDMIISGHTSMLVILCMVILMGISNTLLKVGFWILTSIGLLGVITVERHYTVDMLATLIIVVLMISVYKQSLAKPSWAVRFIEEQDKFGDQIAKMSIRQLIRRHL